MRKGFSLIELAIVLVILGLLTGAVFAGQSMIRASEIRGVATEYHRYASATKTFRDTYYSLPGDYAAAQRVWGAQDANATLCKASASIDERTCNGNGNGRVGYDSSEAYERGRFWQHLANAGLIEGTYTGLDTAPKLPGENIPDSQLSAAGWMIDHIPSPHAGSAHYFAGRYGNHFLFGRPLAANDKLHTPALRPVELWSLDTKIDDGKPGMGNVKASLWSTCTTASASHHTSALYKLESNDIGCAATLNF